MDTENHCMGIKQTKLIVNSPFIAQEDRRPRSCSGSPSLTLGYHPKPTISKRSYVSCFQTPRIKKPSPQQPSHLETESVRTSETFSNLRFLEGLPDMAHMSNPTWPGILYPQGFQVWHLSPLLGPTAVSKPGDNRTWSIKAHLISPPPPPPNVAHLLRCTCGTRDQQRTRNCTERITSLTRSSRRPRGVGSPSTSQRHNICKTRDFTFWLYMQLTQSQVTACFSAGKATGRRTLAVFSGLNSRADRTTMTVRGDRVQFWSWPQNWCSVTQNSSRGAFVCWHDSLFLPPPPLPPPFPHPLHRLCLAPPRIRTNRKEETVMARLHIGHSFITHPFFTEGWCASDVINI